MKKLLLFVVILNVICGGTFIKGSAASSPQPRVPLTLIKLDQLVKCAECNMPNHIVPCYDCAQKFRLKRPKVQTVPRFDKTGKSFFDPGIVVTYNDPAYVKQVILDNNSTKEEISQQYFKQYIFDDKATAGYISQRIDGLSNQNKLFPENCLTSAAEFEVRENGKAYSFDVSYEYKERKEYIEQMKLKLRNAKFEKEDLEEVVPEPIESIDPNDLVGKFSAAVLDEALLEVRAEAEAADEKLKKQIKNGLNAQAIEQQELQFFLKRAAVRNDKRPESDWSELRALTRKAIAISRELQLREEQDQRNADQYFLLLKNKRRFKAFDAWRKASQAQVKARSDAFIGDLTIQTVGLKSDNAAYSAHQNHGAVQAAVPAKGSTTLKVPDSGRSTSRGRLKINPAMGSGSPYNPDLRVNTNASPLSVGQAAGRSPSSVALPSPLVLAAAVASPTATSVGSMGSNASDASRRTTPSASNLQGILAQAKAGEVPPAANNSQHQPRPSDGAPSANGPQQWAHASMLVAIAAVQDMQLHRPVAKRASVAPAPMGNGSATGAATQLHRLPIPSGERLPASSANGGAGKGGSAGAKYMAPADAQSGAAEPEDLPGRGCCSGKAGRNQNSSQCVIA